jgi:hypothetical protein
VYSLFLIEGICRSGSTKFEHVGIHNNLSAVASGVTGLIRSGGGFDLLSDQALTLRVYQQGEAVVEHDLLPFLHLKIPGFATMTFDVGHEVIGGKPEPGNDADGIEDPELLWDMQAEALVEHEAEVMVTVDWHRMYLPSLQLPLLPEGADVSINGRLLRYGITETLS